MSSIILGLLVVAAIYSGAAYIAVTISAIQHGSALGFLGVLLK